MAKSLYVQLKEKIMSMPKGSVVSVSDFLEIAVPKTVSKMLTRLCIEGKINKVLRSIFWIPNGDRSPDPNLVAEALARENNWDVLPSGDTALHLFGLNEEKPTVWTYITNGTYREYKFNDIVISFTHTKANLFSAMSKNTALLVQSIRAIGKKQMTDEKITQLLHFVSQKADVSWNKIVSETRNTAEWVADTIYTLSMLGMKTKSIRA